MLSKFRNEIVHNLTSIEMWREKKPEFCMYF